MSEKITPTHCFWVPGAAYPQDLVHPITGRGAYSDDTPERIAERFPGAYIVELSEYARRRAAEQDTPIEWLPSTRERYEEALNVLPPIDWDLHEGSFLLGEPVDSHAMTGADRFIAYRRIAGAFFVSSRPITRAELRTVRG